MKIPQTAPTKPSAPASQSVIAAARPLEHAVVPHPVELRFARALLDLRSEDLPARPDPRQRFGTHFSLSWDAKAPGFELTLEREPGALLSIRTAETGAPRRLTLLMPLGQASFAVGDLLGLVLRTRGGDGQEYRPVVRSTGRAQPVVTAFSSTVRFSRDPQVATVFHRVRPGEGLARLQDTHVLTLPLPSGDGVFTIVDMRLVVMRAGELADLPHAQTAGGLGARPAAASSNNRE